MKFRLISQQRNERRNGQDGGQKLTSKKSEFLKDVARSRDEQLEANLETIQKDIEDAAGKVAHSTKKTRGKLQNEHRRMCEFVKKPPQGAQQVIKSKVLKKQAKARARTTLLNAVWRQERETFKGSRCRSCVSTGT